MLVVCDPVWGVQTTQEAMSHVRVQHQEEELEEQWCECDLCQKMIASRVSAKSLSTEAEFVSVLAAAAQIRIQPVHLRQRQELQHRMVR